VAARVSGRLLSVVAGEDGTPKEFRLGGVRRVRAVLEQWTESNEWWRGEKGRRVFRVLTDDGAVFEIELDLSTMRWRLGRVYD